MIGDQYKVVDKIEDNRGAGASEGEILTESFDGGVYILRNNENKFVCELYSTNKKDYKKLTDKVIKIKKDNMTVGDFLNQWNGDFRIEDENESVWGEFRENLTEEVLNKAIDNIRLEKTMWTKGAGEIVIII